MILAFEIIGKSFLILIFIDLIHKGQHRNINIFIIHTFEKNLEEKGDICTTTRVIPF